MGTKIKCVVWDLDNTLWDGVLLESEQVALKPNVVQMIKTLDERGILQSIASKNNHDKTMDKLKEFGLDEYFIYPQINWNAKSSSIFQIKTAINIGMDTIAFIDDQDFERNEVKHQHPEVLCLDALNIDDLLEMECMNPKFITQDSKNRRKLYMSDIERNKIEENFEGPPEEFLETLDMVLDLSTVKDDDLKRAEELTVRTHQLNTTGYTYSYEELDAFRFSDKHKLMIAGLEDKFGTYGKIGLVLMECEETHWNLKLFLMSCRVMSRGVGTVILNTLMRQAKANGVKLRAEFISNDRNRMMYITYKFGGFKEIKEKDGMAIFEHDLENIPAMPTYMKITGDWLPEAILCEDQCQRAI